jgi:hypothetical protein
MRCQHCTCKPGAEPALRPVNNVMKSVVKL